MFTYVESRLPPIEDIFDVIRISPSTLVIDIIVVIETSGR